MEFKEDDLPYRPIPTIFRPVHYQAYTYAAKALHRPYRVWTTDVLADNVEVWTQIHGKWNDFRGYLSNYPIRKACVGPGNSVKLWHFSYIVIRHSDWINSHKCYKHVLSLCTVAYRNKLTFSQTWPRENLSRESTAFRDINRAFLDWNELLQKQ